VFHVTVFFKNTPIYPTNVPHRAHLTTDFCVRIEDVNKDREIKTILLKYRFEFAGAIIGAIAGWCYWHFVGCASGTCAITSKPVNSTIYGALMGGLFFSAIKKQPNKDQ
jgi:hypothetical protein